MKFSSAGYRDVFKKAASNMFGKVLNTPLRHFKPQTYKILQKKLMEANKCFWKIGRY